MSEFHWQPYLAKRKNFIDMSRCSDFKTTQDTDLVFEFDQGAPVNFFFPERVACGCWLIWDGKTRQHLKKVDLLTVQKSLEQGFWSEIRYTKMHPINMVGKHQWWWTEGWCRIKSSLKQIYDMFKDVNRNNEIILHLWHIVKKKNH